LIVEGVVLVEIIKSIVFGIIEGITEWLPISSTGHLILADEFMRLNVSDAFKEMFFVVIQLSAILAVATVFFNKINPLGKPKSDQKQVFSLWGKILMGCLPAAIIGVLFDDWFDAHFYNFLTVAIALIVYGVTFIVIENYKKNSTFKINDLNSLDYATAAKIGLFQILALIPGTSRSGATIIGAMLIGASRGIAAEFSFLLAIPVMAGASLLKVLKALNNGLVFTGNEIIILIVGLISSFIVSLIVVKFLLNYLRKHDFKVFGYYRIILGVILIIYALAVSFNFILAIA